MSGQYTLQDGTVVIPPKSSVTDPNLVGINQREGQQPQYQGPVMAQGPVIQPQVQGPPMQPMYQPVQPQYQQPYQQPVPQHHAPVPQEALKQPAQGPVTMRPAPTQAFSIGEPQTTNLAHSAAYPAQGAAPQVAAAPTNDELEALRAENARLKSGRNAEVTKIVQTATGSAENKALLDKWVDANLSAYEKKAINDVLANGSIVEVQGTMNSLVQRYNSGQPQVEHPQNQAPGQPYNPTPIAAVNYNNLPAAPQSTGGYMSAEQFEAAMLSEQYHKDPAYAQQVQAMRRNTIKQELAKQGQPSAPFGRR